VVREPLRTELKIVGPKATFTPQLITSLVLIVIGGLVRGWCYRALGSYFTFEVAIRPNHKLITTGPYAIVRHPSYVALWFTVLGTIGYIYSSRTWFHDSIIQQAGLVAKFCQFAYMMWAASWCILITARTAREDKVMAEAFGAEWVAWSQRVRWMFLPGVY
jgi:protein-S-isoprenylcysteine O-methyltransferase Ste14